RRTRRRLAGRGRPPSRRRARVPPPPPGRETLPTSYRRSPSMCPSIRVRLGPIVSPFPEYASAVFSGTTEHRRMFAPGPPLWRGASAAVAYDVGRGAGEQSAWHEAVALGPELVGVAGHDDGPVPA